MHNKLLPIINTLEELVNDKRIPRNIREKLQTIMEDLKDDKKDIALRIHRAITELDNITEDLNLPMYARTQVWMLITLLESLQS